MGNFLTNISDRLGLKPDFLSSIFKTEKSVLGVDIGSSFIKIVQLRKKGGRAVLETYGELALGPLADLEIGRMTNLSEDKLSQALSSILREANVTTKSAGFSIPLAASLVSFVEMPLLSEKQLASMIPIEARKYIPVPINEVKLDWWIVPKSEVYDEDKEDGSAGGTAEQKAKGPEKVDVLIAAIHNSTLEKYSQVVKKTGLVSSFFEIEVFSTIRSTFSREIAPVMIFDIGAGMTKLSIVEKGIMQSIHIVSRGSQEITLNIASSLGVSIAKAEEMKRDMGLINTTPDGVAIAEIARTNLDYVFSEANRVLLNYERKHGKTINKIILTGGGAILKGFLPEASKNLEAEVSLGDPFAKVEAPAFLTEVLRDAGPEFAVAIGVALRKLQELG
ncbi:MAG: pilus assembly protein PilM [Candidatus Paceibacterota bacterium]|jgi:type IV pilus assembly protein PilM